MARVLSATRHGRSNQPLRVGVTVVPGIQAWVQRTHPAGGFRKVAYSPADDIFATTHDDGGVNTANKAMTSADGGETWTNRALGAANTNRYRCVADCPSIDKFVSPAYTASAAAQASDAARTAWTTNGTSGLISAFEWATDTNLGIGLRDGTNSDGRKTTDGTTWNASNIPTNNKNWYALKRALWGGGGGGNQFAALSFDGLLYYASDGETWNPWNSGNLGNNSWWDMDFSPDLNMLCAVGGTGTNRAATSTSINNFTQRAISARDWQVIKWIGDPLFKWWALSGDGYQAVSDTGVTWVESYTGMTSAWWLGAAYSVSRKRLVAVGTDFGGGTDNIMTADVI